MKLYTFIGCIIILLVLLLILFLFKSVYYKKHRGGQSEESEETEETPMMTPDDIGDKDTLTPDTIPTPTENKETHGSDIPKVITADTVLPDVSAEIDLLDESDIPL